MKNLVRLTCLIGLLISGIVSSQNYDIIKNDKNVIEYFQNEHDFLEKYNMQNKEGINVENIEKGNLEEFYSSFNITEKEFLNFIEIQKKKRDYIEETYNLKGYNLEELEEIITPIVGGIYENVIEDECNKVYTAKIVLNTSVAYAAQMACFAADVTVIAGAICHAAVFAGLTASNYIALSEFKECKKKK